MKKLVPINGIRAFICRCQNSQLCIVKKNSAEVAFQWFHWTFDRRQDKCKENHWQNFVANLLTPENFVWLSGVTRRGQPGQCPGAPEPQGAPKWLDEKNFKYKLTRVVFKWTIHNIFDHNFAALCKNCSVGSGKSGYCTNLFLIFFVINIRIVFWLGLRPRPHD